MIPDRAKIWLMAAVVGAVSFSLAAGPEASYDIWWHLATGRWICDHGRVPHSDPFSWTAQGHRWIAHEWAADVVLFAIHRHLGMQGLVLWRQLLAAAICVAAALLAVRLGAAPWAAGICGIWLAWAIDPAINARPQLLSPLLLLLAWHALEASRQGHRAALLCLAPIAAIWVNVHGSFPLLILLIAVYAVEAALTCESLRAAARALAEHAAIAAGAGVVFLLNPNGLHGVIYPLSYIGGSLKWATDLVLEFQSPRFDAGSFSGSLFLLVLAAPMLAVSGRRARPMELILLVLTGAAFLRWRRMVTIFAATASAILAPHLAQIGAAAARSLPAEGSRISPATARAIALLCLALVALSLPWLAPGTAGPPPFLVPDRAAAFAEINGIRGRLFNTYRFGGYLLWRFYPKPIVFIDGRADAYPPVVGQHYLTIDRAKPGWRKLLERYKIDWVLIDRNRPLAACLRLLPDWVQVYGDRLCVIFVRRGGPNDAVIRAKQEGKLKYPSAK